MKAIFFVALCGIFLSPLVFAEQNLSKINPMSARGFFVKEALKPGELADLQIELQLQEGFFAYQDRFQVEILSPSNMVTGELFIKPIVEFEDTTGKVKKKKKGVRGQGTITTQVSVPKGIASDIMQAEIKLTYIACTKKYCLTPRVINFAVPIKIQKDIQTDKKQQELGSSLFIQEQIDQNLAYALILIFLFGLLTSLTPCVYPLIPITLAVLGTDQKRSKAQSFFVSLSYVLGIGITYAILGVIAAQTGQLFGSLISHPAVIIFMSLIFFIMGLSLLGLFELQAPAFIRNKMTNTQTQKGYLGAFISGLLAGVIASPCVGPVLVGVLAYIAKTQNSSLGFILLFTFAMGFGVLFILLGTFSQLANKLPRSGAWMNTVKTVLALCLFTLSFYYAWPLIKKQFPTQIQQNQSGVAWQKYSQELVDQAKSDSKPVIIDFYADWCAACLELDEFTFSKDLVIKRSEDFLMLKVDATSPTEKVQALSSQYKVFGLPTIIFIGRDGVVREDLTLTGFEEAEPFAERMDRLK